jgi:hypothetical protein
MPNIFSRYDAVVRFHPHPHDRNPVDVIVEKQIVGPDVPGDCF